jgi:phytol kinase
MSRSGNRSEILRGPLYYGIVFVAVTLLYWRESPIGITALMLVCGGDGLADILGRRFGLATLPWNRRKSWVGSLGMFLGGWLLTLAILQSYIALGVFQASLASWLPAVSAIALAATLIESLPLRDIDNLTITCISLVLGHLLF